MKNENKKRKEVLLTTLMALRSAKGLGKKSASWTLEEMASGKNTI